MLHQSSHHSLVISGVSTTADQFGTTHTGRVLLWKWGMSYYSGCGQSKCQVQKKSSSIEHQLLLLRGILLVTSPSQPLNSRIYNVWIQCWSSHFYCWMSKYQASSFAHQRNTVGDLSHLQSLHLRPITSSILSQKSYATSLGNLWLVQSSTLQLGKFRVTKQHLVSSVKLPSQLRISS